MTLLAAVFRRRVLESLGYPVEAVMQVVMYYILFLVLFFGAKAFGGPRVSTGDTLSAVAIGYIVFMFTQSAYSHAAGQIQQQSTAGTLEQLALSRYGLLGVLLTDFVAEALISTALVGIVIVPIMATTGRWLHFDPASVVPIVCLVMVGVVGLGLTMGGLALVFKRVASVAAFTGLSFLFLVAAPVDRLPWLKLAPVAHGNTLLRHSLIDGQSLFAEPVELLILVSVSAAYLALGALVFRAMERIARDRALLGQY